MREIINQIAATLQILEVVAFGEPIVDGRDKVASFGALALSAPKAREGNSDTQLQRLRRAVAGKC